MSMLRKIQRVGKKATKFQYTATYQSVVVECTPKDKWRPRKICVSWTRRGRRFITKLRPWQPSPDNQARGVVIWPEAEVMEITVTLYKGPKDKSYEAKEWEFAVIDVDEEGKRKVLATGPINMVRYASSLPYEHDLHLRLKPVSKKIKAVILEVSLTSEFLKEGKATDDDMMSIASMMSVSNLSTIGFLEDDEDDDYTYMGSGRSISPPEVPDHILSTDELLKWAQALTRDLPDVKITNMTTSWRSGMGFLAIIHHFRPDLLPEFDMQSPNSIKENNRTAFTLARSLGIACPLTPNMMVTTTIPDKLSVTSFVYQMYQYFTQAKQSAIAKAKMEDEKQQEGGSRGTSPNSPFDMSKFDMFAGSNISPVTTPPARTDRVMLYSRHSQDNLRSSLPTEDSEAPLEVRGGGRSEGAGASSGFSSARKMSLDKLVSEHAQTSVAMDTSTRNAVQGQQQHESGHAQLATGHAQSGSSIREGESSGASKFEQDRECEFENQNTDTETSQSDSTTSILEDKSLSELPSAIDPVDSSTDHSMTSGDVSIYKYTPAKVASSRRSGKFSELPPSGRKLPPVPSYTSSPKITDKRKEIQKQAQEMLKRHKLDKIKLSQQDFSVDSTNTKSTNKYRQKALEMLSEAFGTPNSSRSNLSGDDLTSEGSSTSMGMTDTVDDLAARSEDNLQAHHRSLRKAPKSDSALNSTHSETTQKANKPRKLPIVLDTETGKGSHHHEDSRTASSGGDTLESTKKSSNGNNSRTGSNRSSLIGVESIQGAERSKAMSPRRASMGSVDLQKTDTSVTEKERKRSNEQSSEQTSVPKKKLSSDSRRTSESSIPSPRSPVPPASNDPPRGRTLSDVSESTRRPGSSRPAMSAHSGEKPKKKTLRAAPVARPISAQPSRALMKKAEERRREEEKEREERERKEREREEREMAERERVERERAQEKQEVVNQGSHTDGGVDDGILAGDESNQKDQNSSVAPTANGTPKHKKCLPSPSAWSQHSEELSQDLLVTQSEYVKAELISLQAQVQDLEDRAKDIEKDIRGAMSEGNKEGEEELMQEWFGLLNRKNEHIKRQIELNIIEKEEDLEKRQFFLNRELRPLMEIPEDQKTEEQKAREEHLLRELLELIDERDKLERKKMANAKTTRRDRESLAIAQAKSADIVHGTGKPQMTRHGSKDCVIS